MSEQTMVRAHKLGREFYQENPGLRPTFVDALAHIGFNTICDRDAFVAGYRGEQRRDGVSISHWGLFQ